jgi:hypothetical protein
MWLLWAYSLSCFYTDSNVSVIIGNCLPKSSALWACYSGCFHVCQNASWSRTASGLHAQCKIYVPKCMHSLNVSKFEGAVDSWLLYFNDARICWIIHVSPKNQDERCQNLRLSTFSPISVSETLISSIGDHFQVAAVFGAQGVLLDVSFPLKRM